jgi:uncharacterized protein (DUF2147 family)
MSLKQLFTKNRDAKLVATGFAAVSILCLLHRYMFTARKRVTVTNSTCDKGIAAQGRSSGSHSSSPGLHSSSSRTVAPRYTCTYTVKDALEKVYTVTEKDAADLHHVGDTVTYTYKKSDPETLYTGSVTDLALGVVFAVVSGVVMKTAI